MSDAGPMPHPDVSHRPAVPYPRRVDVRRAVGGLGRMLIAAGVLVLLFVAYQLFGTGLAERRSQRELRRQLAGRLAGRPPGATTTTGGGASSTTTVPGSASTLPAGPAPPPTGEALAVIRIPRIGIEKAVVQGVSLEDLKRGPGHYPGTPVPGQPGNAAIAGHRTTYGAPFFRLDEMQPGDPIFVTTSQGSFVYQVQTKQVIGPKENSVLLPSTDNRLTLTTCNPRFSASQRLIIVSELKGTAAEASPTSPSTGPPSLAGESTRPGLSGTAAAKRPAVLWGLLAAAIWFVAWLVGRARPSLGWRAYLFGAPVFLFVLFVFFENFSRLLPANF